MAMGHNLGLHFGADEHPCAIIYGHQGYRWILSTTATWRSKPAGTILVAWLKIQQEGLRRLWSMFPLARVPLWYRLFGPQPHGKASSFDSSSSSASGRHRLLRGGAGEAPRAFRRCPVGCGTWDAGQGRGCGGVNP